MNLIFHIDYPAVLSAAVAYFFLGAVWYSPAVFGRIWMREMNLSDKDGRKANIMPALAGSLLCTLLSAVILQFLITTVYADDALLGANVGLIAGVGFVTPCIMTNCLYENRSLRFLMISAGYHVTGLVLMGAILGAWL